MDQEEYSVIWAKLLAKSRCDSFEKVVVEGTPCWKFAFNIVEPDGRERIPEVWLLTSKESVDLSEIRDYGKLITKNGYDCGLMLTPNALTGATLWGLKATPHVRVYDYDVFTRMLSMHPEIAEEYNIHIETTLPEEARRLLEALDRCSSGREMWKEYQDVIAGIFHYLFVPPLSPPKTQSRAGDGLEIRDILFPNYARSGFWLTVRSDYKGAYIVVEAKNKTDLGKDDVIQLGEYLYEQQVGLFGIMTARGFSQSAIDQRRIAYSKVPHKMVVLVDDQDIREMILKKSRRKRPDEVLRDRIDHYRTSYRI
jgi:hypothetical protein